MSAAEHRQKIEDRLKAIAVELALAGTPYTNQCQWFRRGVVLCRKQAYWIEWSAYGNLAYARSFCCEHAAYWMTAVSGKNLSLRHIGSGRIVQRVDSANRFEELKRVHRQWRDR